MLLEPDLKPKAQNPSTIRIGTGNINRFLMKALCFERTPRMTRLITILNQPTLSRDTNHLYDLCTYLPKASMTTMRSAPTTVQLQPSRVAQSAQHRRSAANSRTQHLSATLGMHTLPSASGASVQYSKRTSWARC